MSLLIGTCVVFMVSSARAASGAGNASNPILAPCPDKPNCVSSQARDKAHAVAPLNLTTTPADAIQRLRQIIDAMPRTRVVATTDDYLHVEFTSALLRFVDDVEFRVDVDAGVIHVRSASRVGHYDFGVNRRRVEAIRIAFERGPARGASP